MRRFVGKNVDEAMDVAFEELGQDAIILTARYVTRRVGNGGATETWAEILAVAAPKVAGPKRRKDAA